MDGHALELEDDTFDVSASQLGVSLFPNLQRGLRELVRVTKPGRVLIVAFGPPQKAEFFGFFLAAMQAVVPGFTGPRWTLLPCSSRWPTARSCARR